MKNKLFIDNIVTTNIYTNGIPFTNNESKLIMYANTKITAKTIVVESACFIPVDI